MATEEESKISASVQESDSQNAFEEERRILLNSMATQLSSIVEKIAVVNDRMDDVSGQNNAIAQVAKIWRDAYRPDGDTDSSSKARQQHTSLSAYTSASR